MLCTCKKFSQAERAHSHRSSSASSGFPAREETAAKKRTLERTVAVHPAAAETGCLSRRIKSGNNLAILAEHAPFEIGLDPTQRFARKDIEANGDDRPVRRIKQAVGLGDTNQPVGRDTGGRCGCL